MIYFIFAIFYLFLEISLFVVFANEFGIWMLFLEILLTGLVGVFILKNYFYLMRDLFVNNNDLSQIISIGILRAIGAILLIMPGILSDVIGILFQFGFFAFLIRKPLDRFGNKRKDENIIDVEVMEKIDEKNHYR